MKLYEVAALLTDFRNTAHEVVPRSEEDADQDVMALVHHGTAILIALLSQTPTASAVASFLIGFYFREWLEVQKDSEIDFVELHTLYNKEG